MVILSLNLASERYWAHKIFWGCGKNEESKHIGKNIGREVEKSYRDQQQYEGCALNVGENAITRKWETENIQWNVYAKIAAGWSLDNNKIERWTYRIPKNCYARAEWKLQHARTTHWRGNFKKLQNSGVWHIDSKCSPNC